MLVMGMQQHGRSILLGIAVAIGAAILAATRSQPYPFHTGTERGEARRLGCLFQEHLRHRSPEFSVTLEGRLQRDTDTFFWSLFSNAFAANPNTPYLYATLPLITLGGGDHWWWWPFPRASFLPSPMWTLEQKDAAVLIGKLPPESTYMGWTTFALWRPHRFVFASLGESLNGLTLEHDPSTGLFAYVICFADKKNPDAASAYSAVMESLVASGLPVSAINVQVLDPDLLSSRWTFYELVLRIFGFRDKAAGRRYLDPANHDHPFFYVSAGTEISKEQQGSSSEDLSKKWPVPSEPTGFRSTKDGGSSTSIREPETLGPAFLQFGNEVVSDLYRIFSGAIEGGLSSNNLHLNNNNYTNHTFGPLHVAEGTACLRHDTECLGGCPDAAYLGLNVDTKDSNSMFEALPAWPTPNELHVVFLVDHRASGNAVYGSLALLGSSEAVLDPGYLTGKVKATSLGVTSLELFAEESPPTTARSPFAAWIFTRNSDHCRILALASSSSPSLKQHRYGCTVVRSRHLSSSYRYVTYLERIYLNPSTGTRPDYDNVLPARLFHMVLADPLKDPSKSKKKKPSTTEETTTKDESPILPFSEIRLPPSQPVVVVGGDEPLRFLHIIKTGGESLERYLWNEPSLSMAYGACLEAAAKGTSSVYDNHEATTAPNDNHEILNILSRTLDSAQKSACHALATVTSSALCGLNCECCAADLFADQPIPNNQADEETRRQGFHGTLLRSPRAHVLSQFSHCHNAHHSSWERIFGDLPLYAAEGILRLTEKACDSSCDVVGDPDWWLALRTRLDRDERDSVRLGHNADGDSQKQRDRVLVISIHNTQSHALTCGKERGSFGHHFRRILATTNSNIDERNLSASAGSAANADNYTPSLEEALSTLERFEWFGITELFGPSLCLLHYQHASPLPPECDCNNSESSSRPPLGYWKETRSRRRRPDDLTPNMLRQIDDHTRVDAALYTHAVRVLLGRLRTVEEATGITILECIDWGRFRAETAYLTDLWTAAPDGLLSKREIDPRL